VPAVNALTEPQKERLLHAVRDLITACHWEGCGGLVLAQEMQRVIAAQACLLTLELGEAWRTGTVVVSWDAALAGVLGGLVGSRIHKGPGRDAGTAQ
jgi:Mlc titration factor MtfA (ptsG expression regulator)